MAPFFQVSERRVAQEADLGPVARDDGAGSLHLAAAGRIIAPGNRVLDHGVGNHQRDVGGNRSQFEAQIAAIQQQGVIFPAVGGDELVHDAATGAYKLVFGPLAKPRQRGPRIADADQRGDGQRRRHFKSRRAGQSRAERHVAPQAEAERGNPVALSREDRGHAERVVAPVLAGSGGQRRRIEALLFLVVLGVKHNLAVGARRNTGQRGKVNGHGHYETLGVIGMLPDQGYTARSHKDLRSRMEAGKVHGTESNRITHIRSQAKSFQNRPPWATKRNHPEPIHATTGR